MLVLVKNIILFRSSSYNIWQHHNLMELILRVSFQTTQKLCFLLQHIKTKDRLFHFIYTHIFSSLVHCLLNFTFSSKVKKFEFRIFSYCNMSYSIFWTMHILSLQNH